ncbi:MAG: fibronectin type III-like domain-contianing protein [Sphingomonas taxi]
MLQRQLVGFRRIAVKWGRSERVAFTLTPRDLSIVDRNGRRHVVPGAYRLYVGGGQPGDGAGEWFDFAVTGADADLPK